MLIILENSMDFLSFFNYNYYFVMNLNLPLKNYFIILNLQMLTLIAHLLHLLFFEYISSI